MENDLSYRNSYEQFLDYCLGKNIKLTDWQQEVAKKLLLSPIGCGKSFLISLLYDYEKR
jgi:hypothetical protein